MAFAASVGLNRRDRDPLSVVRAAVATMHREFAYAPQSTHVDSPIGEVLSARRRVCQDFTHILLATLRRLQLPCRYVSGYLAPDAEAEAGSISITTHAWVDVLLPELGWVGVDPTNGEMAGVRHIRVAVGRDYADSPPTRGVFKGGAASALEASVEVTPGGSLPALDSAATQVSWVANAPTPVAGDERHTQIQQEQQQQQQ